MKKISSIFCFLYASNALCMFSPSPSLEKLLRAIANSELSTVQEILSTDSDLDINAQCYMKHNPTRPLYLAVNVGNHEIVCALLEAKADPNAFGTHKTALHCAVMDSRCAIIESLLAAGADPDICSSEDFGYATPLCVSQHTENSSIELLLKAGANPNGRLRCYGKPLEYAVMPHALKQLFAAGARLNIQNSRGCTELHASSAGRNEKLKLLLECGANPTVINHEAENPLDWALRAHLPAVQELLQAGARPTKLSFMVHQNRHNSEAMQWLLLAGIKTSQETLDKFYQTIKAPLNIFLLQRDFNSFKDTLISYARQNTPPFPDINSSFVMACGQGFEEEVFLFLTVFQQRLQLTSIDILIKALTFSTARGHTKIVTTLLDFFYRNIESAENHISLDNLMRAALWGMDCWYQGPQVDVENVDYNEFEHRRTLLQLLIERGANLNAFTNILNNAILDNDVKLINFLMSISVPIDTEQLLFYEIRDCLEKPTQLLVSFNAPRQQALSFLRNRHRRNDTNEAFFQQYHAILENEILHRERAHDDSYISLLPRDIIIYIIAPMLLTKNNGKKR